MALIYNYTNYREFLEGYYKEQKAISPNFSYKEFADKAGFRSKSFLKLVIDGKKNLSEDSVNKMRGALKLSAKAFSYFKDLVAFNQADSHKSKNYYFARISGYNKRNRAKLVLRDQYEFYSKWYYSTIRELVCMVDFGEDYEKLARLVKPQISCRQARYAVELLLRLGMIKKTETGYRQTDSIITTGNEVESLAVTNFHLQNMVVAGSSLDTCSASQRDISGLVLGLSEQAFETIKSEIQQFRKKLLGIAATVKAPIRVYNLNFHFFPTSQRAVPEESQS